MINFSQKYKQVLLRSMQICSKQSTNLITPRHIFLAIEKTQGCLAYDILIQLKNISKEKSEILNKKNFLKFDFNETAKKIIIKSASIAFKYKHSYVGTEHLLSAFLEIPTDELKNFRLPVEKIKKHLLTILNSSSQLPKFSKPFQQNLTNNNLTDLDQPDSSPIDLYTVDLTIKKNNQNLNPVIGRKNELQRLIQILARKDKNNPVILGEAGVGKTALVEGLAKQITAGTVPPNLRNKKILSLDLGSMIAGTIYRGEFENRLKIVMDQVANNENIILFIDELHNIIGAGSASGSMDAANILKPLLSRGKLRCIGATTLEEYKKHIETDPALERRFQPIHLNEPNKEQSLDILKGIKENYQKFHEVNFTDEALNQAVELSVRYIQDKLLPDKAIDLIDEAAAKAKINSQTKDKLLAKQFEILNSLQDIKKQKQEAILNEDFNLAISLKKTQTIIDLELQNLQTQIAKRKNKINITEQNIIELISQKTNIPITDLQESEYNRLNQICEKLKKIIIAQDLHIDKIMKSIARSKLGLGDENKPLASFLLLGSSGVGKTSTARELAKLLFNNQESFIQVDMSEFSDKFQATKLIGSPAGYVGYRDSNRFTDLVKKNPHCLILFDEIEKAHSDVLDLLLQILEHGHLTDSSGKKINFKNTIIFLTSNLLADKFNKKQIGFGSENQLTDQATILSELKKQLKPEFINRINEIIIYNKLNLANLNLIVDKNLKQLQTKLTGKNLSLKISSNIADHLSKLALAQKSGARAVQKIISHHIEQQLLDKIMTSKKRDFNLTKNKNQLIIQ